MNSHIVALFQNNFTFGCYLLIDAQAVQVTRCQIKWAIRSKFKKRRVNTEQCWQAATLTHAFFVQKKSIDRLGVHFPIIFRQNLLTLFKIPHINLASIVRKEMANMKDERLGYNFVMND